MCIRDRFIVGCATTEGSAGLGAGLGALAGGIVGHQSGHAVEGAIIGGLLGGVTGLIIGNEHQKQLASKQQVEQTYQQTHGQEVAEPMVYWEEFSVTPQSVRPGQKIMANGRYVLMGPDATPAPSGTVTLLKTGESSLGSAPMKEVKEGQVEFQREITIPSDVEDGEYELVVEVVNGSSIAKESQTFTVARAQ